MNNERKIDMSDETTKRVEMRQWYVETDPIGTDGDEVAVTDGCSVICGCWPLGEDFECENGQGPKQRANAKAIAALPELVGALRALTEHSAKMYYAFHMEDATLDKQKELLASAREALVKAGVL